MRPALSCAGTPPHRLPPERSYLRVGVKGLPSTDSCRELPRVTTARDPRPGMSGNPRSPSNGIEPPGRVHRGSQARFPEVTRTSHFGRLSDVQGHFGLLGIGGLPCTPCNEQEYLRPTTHPIRSGSRGPRRPPRPRVQARPLHVSRHGLI